MRKLLASHQRSLRGASKYKPSEASKTYLACVDDVGLTLELVQSVFFGGSGDVDEDGKFFSFFEIPLVDREG
jgi:hypothetical protein